MNEISGSRMLVLQIWTGILLFITGSGSIFFLMLFVATTIEELQKKDNKKKKYDLFWWR